jgi:hypothetical protein
LAFHYTWGSRADFRSMDMSFEVVLLNPCCSSERAGRALVPCWAPLAARH